MTGPPTTSTRRRPETDTTAQILASIETRISILYATARVLQESTSNLDPLGMALEQAALVGARAERKHLQDTANSIRHQALLSSEVA